MKRTPILSILLSIIVIGGLLFLFPVEWVGLALILVALVTYQVMLVRRHLHPIPSRRGTVPSPAPDLSAPRSESFVRREAEAGPADDPPTESSPEEKSDAGALPFDSDVFSKFRAHLESAEKDRPAESNPPPTPPVEVGEEVRVRISSAAKEKGRTAKPAARKESAPEPVREPATETDLFDDLRPEIIQQTTVASGRETAEKKRGGKKATRKFPVEEELTETLRESPEEPPRIDEGEMLLTLAEEALKKGDLAGARAGLDQVLSLYDKIPQSVPWQVKLIESRVSAQEGNLAGAASGFDHILTYHADLGEPAFLEQIEQIAAIRKTEDSASLKSTLLQKLLDHHRRSNNRPAMDAVYGMIEKAQEKVGNEEKLLQIYKNHLEIKRILEDVEGQLNLIDLIGNRYYKMGDTETARQYYEEGLKLREKQDAKS